MRFTYDQRASIPNGTRLHYEAEPGNDGRGYGVSLIDRVGRWDGPRDILRCDDGGVIQARRTLAMVSEGPVRWTYEQRGMIPIGTHVQYVECPAVPGVVGIHGVWRNDVGCTGIEYDEPHGYGRRASAVPGVVIESIETIEDAVIESVQEGRTWGVHARNDIPDGTRLRVTRAVGHPEHIGKTGTWRADGNRFVLDPGQGQIVCRNWDEAEEIRVAPVTGTITSVTELQTWTKMPLARLTTPAGVRVRIDAHPAQGHVGKVGVLNANGGVIPDADPTRLLENWTGLTEIVTEVLTEPVSPTVVIEPEPRRYARYRDVPDGQHIRVWAVGQARLYLGHHGVWDRGQGEFLCETCGDTVTHSLNDGHTFAEDWTGQPTPTPAPTQGAATKATYDALWAALGAMAVRKGWCSDYDRFARRMEGPPRPSGNTPRNVTLVLNGLTVVVHNVTAPQGVTDSAAARQALEAALEAALAPQVADDPDYTALTARLWKELLAEARRQGWESQYDAFATEHGGPPRRSPDVAVDVTIIVNGHPVTVNAVSVPAAADQAERERLARLALGLS